MNPKRIEVLKTQLETFGFDGAIIIPGPTLIYLTAKSFHLMERPVFLFVSRERDPLIVLPELESPKMQSSPLEIEILSYGEDDASRAGALEKAVEFVGVTPHKMAVEPLILRFFEFELLQSAAPEWSFESGMELFTDLRVHKEVDEIEHMQQAIEIAEAALQNTLPMVKIGMTEHDLAAELVIQLLRAGSEPELPFQPIVASGPNSALPHATPTNRHLAEGDALILDWGARSGGYISDITRTFAVGEIKPELAQIHQIVLKANKVGQAAVQPGETCHNIDQTTRQVIHEAGYGDYFIHRTGHGIGLEAHEPPNIRAGDKYILEPGMTFTIEPGIYLNGEAGVRIEDNVLVTEEGVNILTTLTRTLDVVG